YGLQQSQHGIKSGVVSPIDRRPHPSPSSKKVATVFKAFCGLLHPRGDQLFDVFQIHTATPSSLIASISKDDCSGPCSACSRVITTVCRRMPASKPTSHAQRLTILRSKGVTCSTRTSTSRSESGC